MCGANSAGRLKATCFPQKGRFIIFAIFHNRLGVKGKLVFGKFSRVSLYFTCLGLENLITELLLHWKLSHWATPRRYEFCLYIHQGGASSLVMCIVIRSKHFPYSADKCLFSEKVETGVKSRKINYKSESTYPGTIITLQVGI